MKNETVKISLNLENIGMYGIPFALKQHEFFKLPQVEMNTDGIRKKDLKLLINSYAEAHAGLMALLVAVSLKTITPEELKLVLVEQGFIGNSSLN